MAGIAAISDSQQATSADPRVNSSARSAAEPGRVSSSATDDEILGLNNIVRRRDSRGVLGPTEAAKEEQDFDQLELDFASENRRQNGETTSAVPSSAHGTRKSAKNGDAEIGNDPAGAAEAITAAGIAEPAHLKAALEANPELRAAWREAKAYRETFATPEAARDATGMLADLNRMDALFFSRRPEDHAKLARAVADLDPDAFASLARAMTQVSQTAGATFPAIAARSASTERGIAPAAELGSFAPQQAVSASAGVTPAQKQFFNSTNAAAVEGVVEAIEAQVERLLPEGISKSARNRVVGEIYRELDSTLRANRTLTQQMRDAFRSGGLDTSHQKAIVSLITGRARQALPGVAKRVLNEWTTTVVSANQQRRERQRTAERRVDIGGAGGAGNEGRHSMGPREINYARMSDADILNL
jgi:HPt (histidine-containing phosphotransfer) domain-containing protein